MLKASLARPPLSTVVQKAIPLKYGLTKETTAPASSRLTTFASAQLGTIRIRFFVAMSVEGPVCR